MISSLCKLPKPSSSVKCDDHSDCLHCFPGGSAFSGEYVVFWHLELMSVFLCLVPLWIEVDPEVLITPPISPSSNQTSTKLMLNKHLLGNFILSYRSLSALCFCSVAPPSLPKKPLLLVNIPSSGLLLTGAGPPQNFLTEMTPCPTWCTVPGSRVPF